VVGRENKRQRKSNKPSTAGGRELSSQLSQIGPGSF
jgi:hypothetical protein